MVMANMDYRFNGHTLSYNGLYLHTNTQSVGDYFGFDSDVFQEIGTDNSQGLVRRQQTNDNTLLVNQLIYKTELSDRLAVEAGVGYNLVVGNEPDRRINYLSYLGNDILRPTKGSGRHQRYFSEIKEHGINPKIDFSYKLTGDADNKSAINFGYNGRFADKSFETIEYNNTLNEQQEVNRYEFLLGNIFNQEELDNNAFIMDRIWQTYSVDKFINSGYGEVVYEFSKKFTGVAGVRADQVNITIDYALYNGGSTGKEEINELYILPSLNFRYDVTEKSSFRLGISRTYTLPQDKELSPFRYDGPVWRSEGNLDLKPATNYNIDLKWDLYLSPDEIFSLTGYYKYIQDPISRVEKASAGGYLTYDNISDHAIIYGAELEVRKNIFKTVTEEGTNNKLSVGINASYLNTDIKLEDKNDIDFTNSESKLEGAAPGIVNADLSFQVSKNDFSWTNSLVLNYFSERIYTIGTQGYQDIMEKGVPMLDFVTSVRLNKHWGLNLKARNLLNPSFRLTRDPSVNAESVILSDYKKGVSVSFGFSYNL
jgi:outer membrane receptor protein involved in Fe transport